MTIWQLSTEQLEQHLAAVLALPSDGSWERVVYIADVERALAQRRKEDATVDQVAQL